MRVELKNETAITGGLQILVLLIVIVVVGAAFYIYVYKPSEEVTPPVAQVHSLTITAVSVSAGQSSSVTVEAKDIDGNPVSGADISLRFTVPNARGSWGIPLELIDQGNGTYTTVMTSAWAGSYILTAKVEGTDIKASDTITFTPGQIAEVIVTFTSPTINFYFVDAYGNVIPSDQVEPGVKTSFGELGHVQTKANNTFSVALILPDWGVAEVTVTDNKTGLSGSTQGEYLPVYLETTTTVVPPEIEIISYKDLVIEVSEVDDQIISASISVSVPSIRGELGTYYMTIQYDSSVLNFLGAYDGDPTDHFPAPEVEKLVEGSIAIWQFGIPIDETTDVAVLDFRPIEPVDSTPISVTDMYLYDLYDEPIPTPPENVTENGKTFKRVIVPIKAWIVENSGTTEEDVRSDVKKAEDAAHKNALACRLKHWLVYIVEINHISENEWDNKVPDGDIEGTEGVPGETQDNQRENLINQNIWRRWLNVYYVPDNSFEGIGWRTDNVIFIQDNQDFDNRTLTHELVHEFTKSWAKDSPVDNAAAQGARQSGNIMNYDDTGDDISPEQGKKMDEEIDKRTEGGLYKPYRPGPTPPP